MIEFAIVGGAGTMLGLALSQLAIVLGERVRQRRKQQQYRKDIRERMEALAEMEADEEQENELDEEEFSSESISPPPQRPLPASVFSENFGTTPEVKP